MKYQSHGRLPLIVCLLSVSALTLSSCEVNTGRKVLGDTFKKGSSSSTPTVTSDSIGVRFAFRDTSDPADQDTVQIQGITGGGDANLSTICRSDASDCTCEFYKDAIGTDVVGSSLVSYTESTNFLSCKMDSVTTPSDYKYVRIKQISGTKTSGIMNIQLTLTLSDVLGTSHDQAKVRSIYSYGCLRNFLAGAGVTTLGVECNRNNFYLSFIQGVYTYYLYENKFDPTDTNRSAVNNVPSARGAPSVIYNGGGDICTLTQIPVYQCGTNDVERYGLYKEQTALFSIKVGLVASPAGNTFTAGYAAAADATGKCPAGMVKLATYRASPSSVTSPSSNFINVNGILDNVLLETVPYSSTQTYPNDDIFQISTVMNTSQPCYLDPGTNTYTCFLPNDGTGIIQTLNYSDNPITQPFLCGIDKDMIQ